MIIFIILFSIDRIFGTILFKVNDYVKYGDNVGGKLNYYLTKKENTNTLLLGDSRLEFGVIPDSIGSKVFNLAHAGKLLDFHSSVLAILKDKNKLAKNIIVSIDPYVFLESKDFPAFDSSISLRQYYDSEPLVKKYVNNGKDKYCSLKWQSYLYRYNSVLPTLFIDAYKTKKGALVENSGFSFFKKTSTDSLRVVLTVKEKEDRISKYSDNVEPLKIEVLKDILNQCKKNNLNLIMIVPPTKYSVKEKYKKSMRSIKPLLKQYNVPLIDFNDFQKYPAFSQLSLWFDSEHLNLDGAKWFSHYLKEELVARKNIDGFTY